MIPADANPAIAGKIPPDVLASLQIKLNSLEAALVKQDPEMKNHLRESHALLITYPESVHLLQDSEIANLVKAAEEWTKTKIVEEAAKGKGATGKRKKLDVENDL